MDKFKQPILTAYTDGNQVTPVFTKYDPNGEYLHFRKLNVTSWKIVSIDDDGIPINLHHGGRHYNPVTIGHYGLELYSLIASGDTSLDTKSKFTKVINWCLREQDEKGGWKFTFDHMFFKDRVDFLKAPWYSALSQGMMISLLVRAKNLLQIEWRKAIETSLRLIDTDVELGGVKRIAFGEYSFYEEYPTRPASYVLNGFMFCLLGLYDGWKATEDKRFLKAYQDGLIALDNMLPMYDLNNGSSYDLTHITSKVEGPNKARNSYHRLHIQLLSTINSIEDDRFHRVVTRWDAYLRGNELITN